MPRNSLSVGPNRPGLLDLPTDDDSSFHIWREIYRAIISSELSAMKTGETINFELEVRQNLPNGGDSDVLLKAEFICEPGKPARIKI